MIDKSLIVDILELVGTKSLFRNAREIQNNLMARKPRRAVERDANQGTHNRTTLIDEANNASSCFGVLL